MKAIDVASDTKGHAHALLGAGVLAVGLYLRPDRASVLMVSGLAEVGIKRFSIWEKGNPTDATYFSESKGGSDAAAAVAFARKLGMPKGKEIFYAVDFDATLEAIRGPVTDYFVRAQLATKAAGYLCSVYGSGNVCAYLVDKGFAHSGYLSMSKGWGGYREFEPEASIVQITSATIAGFSVDLDDIVNPAVLW